MAKRRLRKYVFTPGVAGVGTLIIPGKWDREDLLVITNVTDNIVLYNFALSQYAGTTVAYTQGELAAFPNLLQKDGGYTTITLGVDTSSMSASDDIQVFVEDVDNGLKIRPWDFGTDAIERMRVSNPQSLIDADFEYGLQPTKWAGYGTVRGYPSAYELPGIDLTVSNVTTDLTNTSINNSLINVHFTAPHNIAIGQVVNVTGLDKGVDGYSRADGNFIVFNSPTTNIVSYFARGIVGTTANQGLFIADTTVKRGALYTGANLAVTAISSDGGNPSNITISFANTHGLIPGTIIHANVGSGSFANLATGPFVIRSTPTKNTFTYQARSGGVVTTPASPIIYAISDATIIHRPYDGGVSLSTKTPAYGAAVIRQSKKYFRYQSGKGYLWSTGTLFKPNYDLQSVTANNTTVGSLITVNTDDVEHGLQAGANVRLEGIETSGYENSYIVNSVLTDYSFTVLAKTPLGSNTAVLGAESSVYVNQWQGACVRAGMFDDQNGVFWEYNGEKLCVVRRSGTTQLSGTMIVESNSNLVRGVDTRFRKQLKVGDKVVIRGMTHFVIDVVNDTVMHVSPDYRGISASGVRGALVKELRIPQEDFNIDTIDGTGPSGFNIDTGKMQMVGIQFSWYGAGFIDFMVRGSDGNWIYAHRIKNNNVNNEAYMRSGNLPIRYSIENDVPAAALTSNVTAIQTNIPIDEVKFFPNTGIIYVDNEIISYNGKSAMSGSANLTNASRAATINLYQSGTNYTCNAGPATTHESRTGVVLISNHCSPVLNHWGSALVLDGGFDTERGYLFNYQATGALTTTPRTMFVIRLAPSVENSQIGALGAKGLLNRSQLLLEAISVAISGATTAARGAVVEGILNPRNFANASWFALNTESAGGQPSFAQVATTVGWTSAGYALPGEQVFSFTAPSAPTGAVNDRLFLDKLKELTGAPLGGDFKYPDGSDILAINMRMAFGTANGDVVLSWSEAQA